MPGKDTALERSVKNKQTKYTGLTYFDATQHQQLQHESLRNKINVIC